eukprot:gene46262-61872_t
MGAAFAQKRNNIRQASRMHAASRCRTTRQPAWSHGRMSASRTEEASDDYRDLDTWASDRILTAIVDAQRASIDAVRAAIPALAEAAEAVAARIRSGGRLVYVGAGSPALMAQAGLRPTDLEDPDSRLPFATYIALMRAAQDLCGNPALALHFGETVDLADVSIVGLIMNASATMGDAFTQMQRFGRL